MGSRTEFTYYLPVTKARLRCEVTTSTDTILNRVATSASPLRASLETVADRERPSRLVVESGFWRDYAFKVGLTEDGRLCEAGMESTGQVGKVLGGVAAVAVGAAAIAAGNFPLVAGIAAAASKVPGGVSGPSLAPAGGATPPARVDRVADAYAAAHPEAATRLSGLAVERAETLKVLDSARGTYLVAVGDGAARKAYRAAREILDDVEVELEKAKAHFAAWRKSTVMETVAAVDLLVPLGALPTFDGTSLLFAEGDDGTAVRTLFDQAGEVLAVRGWESRPVPAVVVAGQVAQQARVAALHVVRPRPVELLTVSGDQTTPLRITAVVRELVMDSACEELEIPVRRSWTAKRRVDVRLSPLGALTGVDFNGASSASAATDAASGVGQAVMGSLESATKARAALDALGAADQDRELAQLKRQVEIGEQRLLAAGQAATAEDFARLARLRQAVEAAELEAALKKHTAG
jgi:hypothetical protein